EAGGERPDVGFLGGGFGHEGADYTRRGAKGSNPVPNGPYPGKSGIFPVQTPIRKWWRHRNARHEPSKGMLKNPEGMAFGKDGTIYVGNQDSSDIVVLNPDGSFRSKFETVEGYVGGDGTKANISR